MFLEHLRAWFLFDHWRQCQANEFHELRQLALSVEQYEWKFYELQQYTSIGDDEGILVQHFIRGLNSFISGGFWVFEPKTMEVAMEIAQIIEENLAMALGGQMGV